MAFEVRLSREMRLVDVTMIGVGAMIGAGIFVLTGIAAGVAGPAIFGLVGQLTRTSRLGILSLIFFFISGGWLLLKVNIEEGRKIAEGGDHL